MEVSTKPYAEKDLRLITTLLSTGDVQFLGTEVHNGVVFCLFTPFDLAQDIVNAYFSYTSKDVQPKTLLEKFDDARNIVFRAKDQARFQEQSNGKVFP